MKEGLKGEAVVPKALAEPLGAWTWDDPSEFSQIEVRELSSRVPAGASLVPGCELAPRGIAVG